MKKYFKRVYNRLLAAVVLGVSLAGNVQAAELALVIDDLGYSKTKGVRAIELPGALTVAVLPFAPHTVFLAAHAAKHDKDVIVHQPMEPFPAKHVRHEQGTLTLGMAPAELRAKFTAALDAIPTRVGVSNHTGSLLTQHRMPMQHLMSEVHARGLFFLDSRTSAQTVALNVALETGVPALKRDVFLDHERDPESIHMAFERALQVARRQGYAVAIGHPYRITLEYLEMRLAAMPDDVRLVKAADLAQRRTRPMRPGVLAQPADLTSLHISPGR